MYWNTEWEQSHSHSHHSVNYKAQLVFIVSCSVCFDLLRDLQSHKYILQKKGQEKKPS